MERFAANRISEKHKESKILEQAEYYVRAKSTIRETAKRFGVSKSSLHTNLAKRLKDIEPKLFTEVQQRIGINKAERNLRGGLAVKAKLEAKKNSK